MTTATGATSDHAADRRDTDRGARRTSRPLTERYQRELLAHCYRMSGSVHEAEDLVQETFLRAWKASADFQGRSLGPHLALPDRHQRLPHQPRGPARGGRCPPGSAPPDQMAGDALEQDHEIAWLEPVPDAAVVVAERDSIRLAFVAALQHLPARQRAVLILRDVLRWSAAEVAEALDTTVGRGQLRAPARARPDGTTAASPRTPSSRTSTTGSGACSTSTSTRSGARTSTRSSGCSRPRRSGRCRRSPAGTSAPTNIGRADRHPVPGRHPRHADDRDPRQRPAGVRPLHAHPGRRLRAVPPPGPRHRRATRSRTSARSSSRRCSRRSGCPPGCPPTTGPATRSRPTSRTGDHVASGTSVHGPR